MSFLPSPPFPLKFEVINFLSLSLSIQDQKGAIKKAAKFLNKNLSDEDVEKLAEHLSFNKMKENPAVNLEPLMSRKEGFSKNSQLKFIRKGQVCLLSNRKYYLFPVSDNNNNIVNYR